MSRFKRRLAYTPLSAAVLLVLSCEREASTDGGVPDVSSPADSSARIEPDVFAADAALVGDSAAADAVAPQSTAWFEDVTEAWGLAFEREPRDGYLTFTDRAGGGVCPIDADGRPPLDLFFAMRPAGESRSRLFVASQAGGPGTSVRYTDETDARGLGEVGDALACLAFDADGDGDEDLVTLGVGTIRLFRNERDRFVDATELLEFEVDARDVYVGAAAGDVDRDGDVDLFVAGFIRFDVSRFKPGQRCGAIPCASSLYEFEGIPNLLLARGSDGRYRNVASSLAPDLARPEMTFVAGILRMSGRGSVDLWVGNDLGARYRDRVLRRGPAGVFSDVAIPLGLATNARGYGVDTMGWSQGDIDGDGELDHVASSWPGDTTAVHFCTREPDELCEERGRDVGLHLGLGAFRWGLGLGDFDLDGDLDLIEATGHLYAQEDLGTTAEEMQAPTFYENVGGRFEYRVFEPSDPLSRRGTMRGLSLVDLDDDGRLDVVMAPARGSPAVLRNVRAPAGRWLRLALRGQAAGARLEARWDGGRIVRAHPVGEGFMGNFDPRVHFGFPPEVTRVRVRVEWPSGRASESETELDRDIVIFEPTGR